MTLSADQRIKLQFADRICEAEALRDQVAERDGQIATLQAALKATVAERDTANARASAVEADLAKLRARKKQKPGE